MLAKPSLTSPVRTICMQGKKKSMVLTIPKPFGPLSHSSTLWPASVSSPFPVGRIPLSVQSNPSRNGGVFKNCWGKNVTPRSVACALAGPRTDRRAFWTRWQWMAVLSMGLQRYSKSTWTMRKVVNRPRQPRKKPRGALPSRWRREREKRTVKVPRMRAGSSKMRIISANPACGPSS